MENEQKSINLNSKRQEFKQRRLKLKSEMEAEISKLEMELQNDYNEKKHEFNQRKLQLKQEMEEKVAEIALEEDAFNISFANWRSNTANHVMPFYDEQGTPIGVRIRVKDMGMDFMIRLHDEFGGKEVEYSKAEQFNLPDEKMARLLGFYRKEVNAMLEQLGGDPLDGWYWTSTPAEEVFGATNVYLQLLFYGAYGTLSSYYRIISYQVRVALAL